MRVILYIPLLLIACLYQVQAQNYIPPSPDALGLAKFANTSVNYYTGAQATSVPLAQLAGKELSVSVSIMYNSTGLKVQEEASSVGLGWSLNAGGLITRMVRGLPDELPNGYCGVNNRGEMANYSVVTNEFKDNVAAGIWDGEPDIFFFNFMGRGGKFFLDANGVAHTMPFQDLIIRPAICNPGRSEWEIIDENGTRYIFGGTNYTETSSYRKVSPANSPTTSYVSTWHLKRIETANNTDFLNFTYTSAGTTEFINYFFTKDEPGTVIKNESTKVSVPTKIISQISSPLGNMQFGWTGGRLDTGGKFLSSVTTYNSSNQQISKTRLEYSYFQTPNCADDRLCKRLRLDKVFDLAPDPIAAFEYNTAQNLPAKNSPNIDHWGYYNNNTVNSWLPASSCSGDEVLNFCGGNGHSFSGASRQPDAEKVKANLLVKINQRGGGYQRFNYEIHIAKDGLSIISSIGGVRISSIEYSSGIGPLNYKNFYYVKEASTETSGSVYYKPVFYAFNTAGSNFKRFSHSLSSTFDLNGSHVGYDRVEEIIAGQGKVVYHFTNPWSGLFDFANPVAYPVSPADWLRGSIIKVENFNSGGQLIAVQEYDYNQMASKKTIKAFTTSVLNGITYSYNLISIPYKNVELVNETYDPINVSKKIAVVSTYEYDPITFQLIATSMHNSVQPTVKYINKVKYITDPLYNTIQWNGRDCDQERIDCQDGCAQLTENDRFECESQCQSSYESCLQQEPSYTTPMESSILLMRQRHQTNVPVETIKLYTDGVTTKVLSASVNTFKTIGNPKKVVPAELWSLKVAVPEVNYIYSEVNANRLFTFDNLKFRKNITFDSYDLNTGNLLQQSSVGGIIQTQTWLPDGTLPLTTTVTAPGMSPRSTSYTYKPMVGQTSVIDANGNTIKYEYDVFNRVSKVKDENDHIMKQYRYHYKNETPGFRITSIKESNPGDMVTYYATDVASSVGGNPRLVWDMGDGRVVDNNSTQVSHAYATPGAYTVKLAGLNPEYGPVTRTQQVNVYPLVAGTICADGPIVVDLCGANAPYFEHCPGNQNTYASSPITFTFNVAGGCPSSYAYAWKYKNIQDTNWFYATETSNQYTLHPGLTEGIFLIECTVTDACGKSFTTSYSIERYKSNPQCSGGIGFE